MREPGREIFEMKRFKTVFALVPLVIFAILMVISHVNQPKHLDLFEKVSAVSFWPWAESKSKILSSSFDENGMECSYRLHESAPYAGFTVAPTDSKFWDISSYEYLEIGIDTAKSTTAQVSINYFLEGFSDEERWESLQITLLPLQSIYKDKYRIAIRDLITPTWWYRENNIQAKDVPPINYATVANIGFVNGEDQLPGSDNCIAITSLRFVAEEKISMALLLTLFLLYAGVLILFLLLKKRIVPLPKLNKLSLSNYVDEEYDRIATFMGENYTTKSLTAGMVAEQVGVSSAKVSQLIHSFRGQSYNQFLNSLRLKEAKRLLRETDRNVSDISSHVGYGYVNSFNRVFKEFEGTTPLEYRSGDKKGK